MSRIAVALLALASWVPPQDESAASRIKMQLEGVRAPIYADRRALPGVTATYSVVTTGCRTRFEVNLPTHVVGSTTRPASVEQVQVDWSTAVSVRPANAYSAYAVVTAPGLPAAGHYFYAGSPAAVARLKVSMDALAAACAGPAAAASAQSPAPTDIAALSQRLPEKPDVLGTPQCRFRHIPALLLTDNKPPIPRLATWSITPREGGDKDTRFDFSAEPGDQVASWRGILATGPALRFRDPRFRDHKIKTVLFYVDGRDPALNLRINQPGGPSAFSTSVSVVPNTIADEGFFFERLARADSVVVRLFDTQGNGYGPWTYDVSTLRHIPAALKGARWRCK